MLIRQILSFVFVLATFTHFADNTPKEPHLRCFDDCQRAMSELREFARNGSPHAQTLLALTYKTGELYGQVKRDRAWRWMNKAKNQAFPPAMYYLSQWYRSGFHTTTDNTEADRYLLRSATYGYAPALYEYGVRQLAAGNKDKGLRYIQAASDENYQRAEQFLEDIESSRQRIETAKQTSDGLNKLLAKDKINDNVLTVVASQVEPETFLINVLDLIKEQGVYSDRGTTASRVSSVKCGQPGSGCRLIDFKNDPMSASDLWLRGMYGR